MKKNSEVYRDERFVLGWNNGIPYLKADGGRYILTGHPYEPCLYITEEDGRLTVVRHSFYVYDVLDLFADGHTVTSVTGLEYRARDFCRMVEYAAGKGELSVSDAEKIFGDRNSNEVIGTSKEYKPRSFDTAKATVRACEAVIENDLVYDVLREYPDRVIDYCLVKNNGSYRGYESHEKALEAACVKMFYDADSELEWQYDMGKAKAKKLPAEELFETASGKLTYRRAFLDPPYPNNYKNADFDRVNDALFPNGTEEIELYEWTTDWSEYFDEGHEWWGALCLTVYDKTKDRFVIIMASSTD